MRPSANPLFGESWYRSLEGHDLEDPSASGKPSPGSFDELKDVSLEEMSNTKCYTQSVEGTRNLPGSLSLQEGVVGEEERQGGEMSEADEETPLKKLPHQINLHISGNVVVKKITCDLDWKIAEAKQQMFPDDFETKKIRIICRGKLLSDDGARLGDFVENGGHLHISITEKRRPGESDPEEEDRSTFDIQDSLIEDLRLAGMLQIADNNQVDHWDEETQQRNGSNTEFVLFALAGMLLGFIMLIFLFQAGVTRKKKYGIFAGITLHVIINLTGSDYFSVP